MYKYLITPEQLKQHLHEPGYLIFDVRHDLLNHQAGLHAYQQGHIPGALFLDHEQQLAAEKTGKNGRHPLPKRSDFAALMRLQGLGTRTQVVVYDSSNGLFACHLWWMLRWLGHEKVAVLEGGWPAWLAIGGEQETGIRKPARTEAQALQSLPMSEHAAMPVRTVDQVSAELGSDNRVVLDARAPERFRGEHEPMDPVAGHIPGALNRSHLQNLEADGKFKTIEKLREEFDALLGHIKPPQVTHQCGSGITACHNLFAMEMAGLAGSNLYPGSWSEWVADASRPVELD